MISVIVTTLSILTIAINAYTIYKIRKLFMFKNPFKYLLKEGFYIHEQSSNRFIFRKIFDVGICDVVDDDLIWELSERDSPLLPIHTYMDFIFHKDNTHGIWTVHKCLMPAFSDQENDELIKKILKSNLLLRNFTDDELKMSSKIIKYLNKLK